MSEEGEFKKRVFNTNYERAFHWGPVIDHGKKTGREYDDEVALESAISKEDIFDILEDAKKEIFESMPKRTEMYMLNEKWVRIPFDEWQKLLTCWQTVEKWFGKLEVIE